MTEVKGLRELSRKLAQFESKVAGKTLRSSAMLATTPAFKEMKKRAPRGKKARRTYKGNLVAPGFLSRSIKRKSRYRSGTAVVLLGVKKEAFYGVLFVEKGTKPHRIPKNGRGRLRLGNRWVTHVNHPGARKKPWFVPSFTQNKRRMIDRFGEQLRRKIQKLTI